MHKEEFVMAKFENEGHCPCIWVPKTWDETTDSRLVGLWSLIGSSIVYSNDGDPDTTQCDEMFGVDVIAYDLLSAIIKKNVNANKILVHQLRNGACNTQKTSDIQKTIVESKNPELVMHAGSNFAVVLADADYGIDLWVWDLRTCC